MKVFEKVKAGFRNREAKRAALIGSAYWFVTLMYMEVLLHGAVFGEFGRKMAYIAGFCLAVAGILTIVISLLPKRAGFWAALAVTLGLVVLYGSQMVYYDIFGTLYSTSLVQQGGAAVTSFWRETLNTILANLPGLLLLSVPAAVLILLRKKAAAGWSKMNWPWRGALAAAAVLAQIVTVQCLAIGGTGYYTDYYFYYSDTATTNQTAERFGLLTAFRLELTAVGKVSNTSYYIPEATQPAAAENNGAEDATETTEAAEAEAQPQYNVLNIDFDALSQMTEDETILALNAYCSQLTGTNKNAYTGMLADYNLIVLCAESFSTAAIHADVTPTLYRLANEGIIFTNYYNSFPNTTTDGEYTLCMGLYPDSSRGKSVSSMYASRNSYLPFTLGNIFSEQRGVVSRGYHNYVGSYYGRDESHPNMGYIMKFAGDGMTFTNAWPASDLEMMEQSVDDYISTGEQFHAYYMTFSGHYQYDTSTNGIARQNWDVVEDLDYSDTAKAYLSCHVELDKALEYLMQRLEEAGIADKTAIVIAGDHYPYGLKDYQYEELVEHEIDDFSKYKSTLIFWVGGLEENIVVDEYCCNVDILPTILNLWGFSYDSRMLAGTDVFSEGEHVAVLADQSFLTDKIWFDAGTGQTRYLVEESGIPEGYLERMIQLVRTKFSVSTDILNSAYYNFVFEMGNVTIDRDSWYVAPPEEDEKAGEAGADTDVGGTGEDQIGGEDGGDPEAGEAENAGEAPDGGGGDAAGEDQPPDEEANGENPGQNDAPDTPGAPGTGADAGEEENG